MKKKINPLASASSNHFFNLPDKMKIPKAYDELMAEHAKADYVSSHSYRMAEVFRLAGDMVMSWYWSQPVQRFVHETDVEIENINLRQLPFEQMFFEFERGPYSSIQYGCFITVSAKRDEPQLFFQPVAFGKWYYDEKPYWSYIAEGYTITQRDADCLTKWFKINYETKSLEVNFTEQDDEKGLHVFGMRHQGQWAGMPIDEKMSNLAKNIGTNALHFLLKLMILMECSNAPVEMVNPSALKMRMAKKARKPEPRPYRILKLSSSEHTHAANMGATGLGGTVRTHLRRGHIRNIKTARGHIRRWIKPCIVNAAKGDKIINETVVT